VRLCEDTKVAGILMIYTVILHKKKLHTNFYSYALACIASSTTLKWHSTRYSAVPCNSIPHIHFLWANWEVYTVADLGGYPRYPWIPPFDRTDRELHN